MEKKKKKKLMQFPGEAQSYSAGNSIMTRSILSRFQSLAKSIDYVLLLVNGKDKPNHVSLLHPDPAGSPSFSLKEAYSSCAPKDN